MKSLLILILLPLMSCSQKNMSFQLLKDVEYLSSDSFKGRKTGTSENKKVASFIAERFRKLGLKSYAPGYLQAFSFTTKENSEVRGANVIGYIPGNRDQVIVISAHFDHIGVIKGQIFNGADDNASGTAALLSMAAYFSKTKPAYTLVFAAFDAEEMGLQGSNAFVAKPPVSLAKMKINVNMDMISHNEKGELYVAGTFTNPQLKQFLPEGNETITIIAGHDDPKLGLDDWTNQSDQGSFNKKGIPFLYFGVEDHEDYHKESDEYQNINQAFFIHAAEAIKEVVKKLDIAL